MNEGEKSALHKRHNFASKYGNPHAQRIAKSKAIFFDWLRGSVGFFELNQVKITRQFDRQNSVILVLEAYVDLLSGLWKDPADGIESRPFTS